MGDKYKREHAAAAERARIVEEDLHADALRDREERRSGVCADWEGACASDQSRMEYGKAARASVVEASLHADALRDRAERRTHTAGPGGRVE